MNLQDSAASSACSDSSSDEGASDLRDTLTYEKLAALSAKSALMLETSATPSAAAVSGNPAAEEDEGFAGLPVALLPGSRVDPCLREPAIRQGRRELAPPPE